MLKRVVNLSTSIVLGMSSLFVFAPVMVSAAADTCTWTGGGADANFSTAGNWSCSVDQLDTTGDALVFDASTVDFNVKDPVNDMVGATFTSITWTEDASNSDAATISGTAFSLSGDIISTTAGLTIENDLTITAGVDFGRVNLDGDVALGANTVDVSGDTTIDGIVSGSGGFDVLVSATLTLNAKNTFTGNITVADLGRLDVACAEDSTALGTSAGSTTISDGGLLIVRANTAYAEPISIAGSLPESALYIGGCSGGGGGGVAVSKIAPISVSTTTFTGAVTLTDDTYMSTYFTQRIVFENMVLGGNSLIQTSSSTGTIVYNNETLAYKNKTITIAPSDENTSFNSVIPGDTLVVNGTTGFVELHDGSTLMGSGTVVNGFNAHPNSNVAVGNSPGCLKTDGVNMSAANFIVEVAGADACTGYDQLQVTNADAEAADFEDVHLFDAKLSLSFPSGDYLPAAGTKFVVINNEGTDAVQGTFQNLPEGETFEANGGVFRVSYVGGDGNDVEITVVSAPTAPDTGFGLLGASPTIMFAAATLAAGAIMFLGRRYSKFSA